MKILGINFGAQPQLVKRSEPQAMSTPFLKVGSGNLALPYIQNSVSGRGMVYFGQDNLYPQLLNQMYYTSPIHGAVIDFTVRAVIGGGVDIITDTMAQDLDAGIFKRSVKMKKLFDTLTLDFYIHNRVYLDLTFSDSGKFLTAKRIEPANIRHRFDGGVEYSTDWSTQSERRDLVKYQHGKKNVGNVVWEYKIDTPGMDYYPLPTYSSAMNWCFLDGEQSFLQKNNIQESIFPSMFIRRPKRFANQKEIDDFKAGLMRKKGAENAGHIGVLSGDGFENTPEVVAPPSSQNDNLFIQTEKSIKDNICYAHKINPSIVGIKVAGSLGNAQELEMSYAIWEKNVVLPLREIIEDLGKTLLQIAGIVGEFKVNDFKLFGNVEEAGTVDTGTLIDSMSPLLANKVLESLTKNEIRGLAGLKSIKGGDDVPNSLTPPAL